MLESHESIALTKLIVIIYNDNVHTVIPNIPNFYINLFLERLRSHKIIHNVKDKYKCPFCEYSTVRKPHLKRHMKQHSNLEEKTRNKKKEESTVFMEDETSLSGKQYFLTVYTKFSVIFIEAL